MKRQKYITGDERRLRGRARSAVARAITGRTLIKPDACVECGANGMIYAHHQDHSKPMEVTWLCHGCVEKKRQALIAAYKARRPARPEPFPALVKAGRHRCVPCKAGECHACAGAGEGAFATPCRCECRTPVKLAMDIPTGLMVAIDEEAMKRHTTRAAVVLERLSRI